MISKQCNSCKYLIYVKELGEMCYLLSRDFMKNQVCNNYKNGDINQAHKEIFKKLGREYPFTEMR